MRVNSIPPYDVAARGVVPKWLRTNGKTPTGPRSFNIGVDGSAKGQWTGFEPVHNLTERAERFGKRVKKSLTTLLRGAP